MRASPVDALTWNLAAVFGRWHADWSPLGRVVVALLGVLLFWGCVVLHELAHALVANHNDVPVRGVTLFLFGGVSSIEQEPRSAGVELAMAIAGPIVSLLLGVLFLLIGAAAVGPVLATGGPGTDEWTAVSHVGPVATLLIWLGPVNIFIGFFNLIPAFPLDGGRILRAIVWAIDRNHVAATRVASVVGQTMRVTDVMRPREAVVVAEPQDPLSDAYERMVREDIEQLPVLEAQSLVGMLRRRDVARWLELAWRPSSSGHRGGGTRTPPPLTPRAAGT